MPRIIQSIHLSDYQARVMLIVQQAPTPEVAYEELGNQDPRIEDNLLGARDAMAKIGLLELGPNAISVTEKGEEVMRDEYLIDESGQPTEKGNEILQAHSDEQPEPGPAGEAPPGPEQGAEQAPVAAGGEMETTDQMPAESSIFRYVHDLAKLQG